LPDIEEIVMTTTTIKAERPKRKRWIAIGVAVVLLLVGFLVVSTLGRIRDNRAALEAQTGDTVTAFIGDLAASATASGQVEASQKAGLSANAPGLVTDVYVRVGDQVLTGDAMVQLDTADLVFGVERARQNLALQEANLAALLDGAAAEDIAAAETAVVSAQVNLADLLAGPGELDITESEANIRAQQANVSSASASYNSTRDSISASTIASAEADLLSAQIAYDQAKEMNESFAIASTHDRLEDAAQDLTITQAALDGLLAGPKQGNLTSSASGITAAVANVDQAQANHTALLAGPTAAQVAGAEASLAQVQAQLASLTAGPSLEEIAIAEAGVEQARLALEGAEEALAKATITAPFDGVVTATYVTEGEYATGNVVELASSDLEVVLSVDEIDVGSLSPGQPAVITLETWPAEEISGIVASIAPAAGNSSSGIVTYDVQIALEETDLPILVGMTANAQLITAEHENALLVPNAAITADREAGTFTVNLVTGESERPGNLRGNLPSVPTTEKVEVVIGLKDGQYTQVLSGLSAGDEVIIGEIVAPVSSFGPGGGSNNDDGGPFGGG
jgi:HlyD family secretion protein